MNFIVTVTSDKIIIIIINNMNFIMWIWCEIFSYSESRCPVETIWNVDKSDSNCLFALSLSMLFTYNSYIFIVLVIY